MYRMADADSALDGGEHIGRIKAVIDREGEESHGIAEIEGAYHRGVGQDDRIVEAGAY